MRWREKRGGVSKAIKMAMPFQLSKQYIHDEKESQISNMVGSQQGCLLEGCQGKGKYTGRHIAEEEIDRVFSTWRYPICKHEEERWGDSLDHSKAHNFEMSSAFEDSSVSQGLIH